MFVLTASPHSITDVCLKHNDIFELFEKVWSVEDFKLSKSDTRIFYKVAETIGCQPCEIHYFDDSLIALENAKRLVILPMECMISKTTMISTEWKKSYRIYW